MKKLLIIGSKGFIGGHANNYFSSGHKAECWGADVISDYSAKNYFIIDSSNSDFNELFESQAFDVCINCSGAASVPDSLQHPLRDFSLNTYNVIKILEAIKRHAPHCRFINLSSAAVYGNPASLPVKESDECIPVSPYGKHKYFAEELCREYHQYFGIESCSLRIFSAYGPGLKKQILWDLCKKSQASKSITLFGTGNETRDFIYVEDIIAAIDIIISKGNFEASVYNVASGKEVSIKELSSELLDQINYKGGLNFSGSERLGDPINWKADISKLKKLGFEPAFSIQRGINKYIQWLKEEKLL